DPSSMPRIGFTVGRAIRSLRLLAEINYEALSWRISLTERLLLEDPMGAYGKMDSATRDVYRRAVEELSRTSGRDEGEVCRTALDLARSDGQVLRNRHVVDWLLDNGRPTIESTLGVRTRTLQNRVLAAPRAWFFGVLFLTHLALLAPILIYLLLLKTGWPIVLVALLITWFPASVPAATFVQWLFARLVRPRALFKLDFSDGIPAELRTLVAIPTLLGDSAAIDELLGRLEVHYLTNPDPQRTFSL